MSAGALARNLEAIEAQIAAACAQAGRARHEVRLLAVSKLISPERIAEALDAGQRDFGENYAQELRDKARLLADRAPTWHFIGPLQRNKVKYVVGTAALVHSVDSAPLLDEIAGRAAALGIVQHLCLQVNLGDERQKAGVAVAALPALIDRARQLHSVQLEGLMCIPPVDQAPRPHFARLRTLAEAHGLAQLSMGMSADFVDAILEGSTFIRVGTALFGARDAGVRA